MGLCGIEMGHGKPCKSSQPPHNFDKSSIKKFAYAGGIKHCAGIFTAIAMLKPEKLLYKHRSINSFPFSTLLFLKSLTQNNGKPNRRSIAAQGRSAISN